MGGRDLAYILGVRNRRLWTCDEHGVIYSAPDDATVYGDVTCPECGERLLRYPPPNRVFWLCSANPPTKDGTAYHRRIVVARNAVTKRLRGDCRPYIDCRELPVVGIG